MVKKSSTLLEGVTKECFDFVNMVRANPKVILPKLEEMKKSFKKNVLSMKGQPSLPTQEGKSAVAECIKFIKKQPPTRQFEWDELIGRSCKDHCKDIGPKGTMSHKSSNGDEAHERILKYGSVFGMIGENLNYGHHTGEEIIMALIIDDGVANRGHRTNIFSDRFSVVGIFVGAHNSMYNVMACMVLTCEHVVANNGTTPLRKRPPRSAAVKAPSPSRVSVPKSSASAPTSSGTLGGGGGSMKKKMQAFLKEAVHIDKPPDMIDYETSTKVNFSGNELTKVVTTKFMLKDGTETTTVQVITKKL